MNRGRSILKDSLRETLTHVVSALAALAPLAP